MNKIKIKNFRKRVKINNLKLRALANRALKTQKISGKEVSILFVDDNVMQELNYKYLKKKSPTDVLAFRMADGDFSDIHPEILGDIIISLDTARSRAKIYNTTFEYEVSLYVAHGILHLLGFKDTTKKGFLEMQRIQKEMVGDCA